MTDDFLPRQPLSLSTIALTTIIFGFGSTVLTDVVFGLSNPESNVLALVFWTIPVIGSLVLLFCGLTNLLFHRVRYLYYLSVIPLGAFHGYVWGCFVWHIFGSSVARWQGVFTPTWIVVGICSALAVAVLTVSNLRSYMPNGSAVQKMKRGLLLLFGLGVIISSCVLGLTALLGDGVIQHTVSNPNQQVTALVIRDDCGATCGCEVRVDLQAQDVYLNEVYRNGTACDVTVTWVSTTKLSIIDDEGSETQLDIHLLGLLSHVP